MQEVQAQTEDQIPGGEDQAVAVAIPANATATSPPVYLGEDLINLFRESNRLLTKIDKNEDKLEDSRSMKTWKGEADAHKEWLKRLRTYGLALKRAHAAMEEGLDVDPKVIDELDLLETATNESEANYKAYGERVKCLKAEIAKDRASWQKLVDHGTIPKSQSPGNDRGGS